MCSQRLPLVPVLTVLIAITAFGCVGETQSAAEWDGTVRDSGGVQLVQNFGAPLWTDETRWTLTELLKIGTVSGDPDYQFGAIGGFAVLSDGRMVVADRMAQHLRFFSPEGEHIRTVGKAGSGPGEFGPGGMSVLRAAGDTLLVPDWANMQVHQIASDGEWLASWRFAPEGGWAVRGWDDTPTGRVVSQMTPLRTPDSQVTDTLDLVLARDVRGAVLDTVARVPSSKFFRRSGDAPEWHFYAGDPDFDLLPEGGIVTGRSDHYRLKWYDVNGDLARIVSLAREKLPFTDEDRTLVMNRIDRILRDADLPPARVAQLKSAVHFEDTYPAFRRFICGPGGTVWVQHVRPISQLSSEEQENFGLAPDPPGTQDWDVFDREGRYLGIVTLPQRFDFRRVLRDKVYGIWEDELDVQHLMVLQIDQLAG
jgi:hypothetical protein